MSLIGVSHFSNCCRRWWFLHGCFSLPICSYENNWTRKPYYGICSQVFYVLKSYYMNWLDFSNSAQETTTNSNSLTTTWVRLKQSIGPVSSSGAGRQEASSNYLAFSQSFLAILRLSGAKHCIRTDAVCPPISAALVSPHIYLNIPKIRECMRSYPHFVFHGSRHKA